MDDEFRKAIITFPKVNAEQWELILSRLGSIRQLGDFPEIRLELLSIEEADGLFQPFKSE